MANCFSFSRRRSSSSHSSFSSHSSSHRSSRSSSRSRRSRRSRGGRDRDSRYTRSRSRSRRRSDSRSRQRSGGVGSRRRYDRTRSHSTDRGRDRNRERDRDRDRGRRYTGRRRTRQEILLKIPKPLQIPWFEKKIKGFFSEIDRKNHSLPQVSLAFSFGWSLPASEPQLSIQEGREHQSKPLPLTCC